MYKILFLSSGNGGLLKFFNKCIRLRIVSGCEICGVISHRECGALEYARNVGLTAYLALSNPKDQVELEQTMSSIDFDVCITNIHLILNHSIVSKFENKLLNVHPSLLPAFKGFRAVERAVEQKCKFIGTTVHRVNELADDGVILAQTVTLVEPFDTIESIYNKLFRAWCLNLLNVLIGEGGIAIPAGECSGYECTMFNPRLVFDTGMFDEEFWNQIGEE